MWGGDTSNIQFEVPGALSYTTTSTILSTVEYGMYGMYDVI